MKTTYKDRKTGVMITFDVHARCNSRMAQNCHAGVVRRFYDFNDPDAPPITRIVRVVRESVSITRRQALKRVCPSCITKFTTIWDATYSKNEC